MANVLATRVPVPTQLRRSRQLDCTPARQTTPPACTGHALSGAGQVRVHCRSGAVQPTNSLGRATLLVLRLEQLQFLNSPRYTHSFDPNIVAPKKERAVLKHPSSRRSSIISCRTPFTTLYNSREYFAPVSSSYCTTGPCQKSRAQSHEITISDRTPYASHNAPFRPPPLVHRCHAARIFFFVYRDPHRRAQYISRTH